MSFINGVTVDRLTNWDTGRDMVPDIAAALAALPAKPTIRLVIDRYVDLADYRRALLAFRPVAHVMLCPVDSTEMAKLTREAHSKRFRDCYEKLGDLVDGWEVGNEINGSWAMTPEPKRGKLLAGAPEPATPYEKMSDALLLLKAVHAVTALTLWYTPAEDAAPDEEPVHWLDSHLPVRPDLVLVSVYERWYTDTGVRHLQRLRAFFQELERRFPTADLGIGEFGPLSADGEDASPVGLAHEQQLQRYYGFRAPVTRWVGGGFYWFFADKCVPKGKPLFPVLQRAMQKAVAT